MSNDTPNSRQVADNWDLNAPHYDAVHGDERVLDIGCGNRANYSAGIKIRSGAAPCSRRVLAASSTISPNAA